MYTTLVSRGITNRTPMVLGDLDERYEALVRFNGRQRAERSGPLAGLSQRARHDPRVYCLGGTALLRSHGLRTDRPRFSSPARAARSLSTLKTGLRATRRPVRRIQSSSGNRNGDNQI
jgi:hypothetical protein